MKTIQVKVIAILLIPLFAIVFISLTVYTRVERINATSRANYALQRKSEVVGQALLSLQDASSSLGFSLTPQSGATLQQVRNYEALFNNSVFELQAYTNALLLGSESNEYKQLENGTYYDYWHTVYSEDFNDVSAVDQDSQMLLEDVVTIQTNFVSSAQESFILKKQDLEQGSETHESELLGLDQQIQTNKELLSNKMKDLVKSNNKILSQNTLEYRRQITSLYETIVLASFVAILLMMIVGVTVSHLLIIKPIRSLTRVATDISVGKLDAKIDQQILDSRDEIGGLARAFDRTLVSLKLAMKEQRSPEEEKQKENALTLESKNA